MYAVVKKGQGSTQRLIRAKYWLAKRNLLIPRLELIADYMPLNLATNVQAAFKVIPSTVHCWLDSTFALQWIKDRQFVSNRVHKIQQYSRVARHRVPTEENRADLWSRGGHVVNDKIDR